jgi:hypothetical protein
MQLSAMKHEAHGHMDPEDLERYSLGRTTPDETAGVEEHLLICEKCRDKLDETESFAFAVTAATAELHRTGAKRWSKVAVLAAAACLLLAARAALWWSRGHEAPIAVSLMALRANSTVSVPTGRTLELRPDLTGLPAASTFRIEVVDQSGKPVWRGELAATRTAVVVPAQSAGAYFVRLYTPSGELLREYGLQIGR